MIRFSPVNFTGGKGLAGESGRGGGALSTRVTASSGAESLVGRWLHSTARDRTDST